MVRQRARLRFRKTGDLRMVGHRDLMRVWERLLRRAGVRLAMSQGFHPRPKISFPSALGIGIAGVDEVVELEFDAEPTDPPLTESLAEHLPPGLTVSSVTLLPLGTPAGQVASVSFELPIPPDRCPSLALRIAEVRESDATWIERGPGREPIRLQDHLLDLRLEDSLLRLRLRIDRQGSVRIRDALAALDLADAELTFGGLTRTAVEMAP